MYDICVHVYILFMYIYIHTYKFCIHVCICMYVYVCIFMYVHTHNDYPRLFPGWYVFTHRIVVKIRSCLFLLLARFLCRRSQPFFETTSHLADSILPRGTWTRHTCKLSARHIHSPGATPRNCVNFLSCIFLHALPTKRHGAGSAE